MPGSRAHGAESASGWFARSREDRLLLLLSVLIGALVGLVIVAFILLTGSLSTRMYPAGGAGWRRIVLPTLGSLLTGWLLWRFFPSARGSGIPQTKAALAIEGGSIPFSAVAGKFLCCSVSLATGLALGREGPSVHIGAGLASVIARNCGLSKDRVKALVPIGCSAALAAAFNTPIAAVLFTLEEILGDLHAATIGSSVLAAVTAWMVLHLILGDDPLFHVAGYRLLNPWELSIYAMLGIVGGLGSTAFVRLLLWIRLCFKRLPARTAWLQPVVGGLTVGLIGYFMPDVMGVGYGRVERVLGGDVAVRAVILLCILKIVATAVCYSSGNAGGIFGPALFIGAMMGAAVGGTAHNLFPAWTAGPGAYALVGMGTAFAGIIRTPMTSVIMIFELTRDYSIIVPLMISNLIAYYIAARLTQEPIYEALARQDGIHLPTTEARLHGTRSEISSVMRPPETAFSAAEPARFALAWMKANSVDAWPVVDGGRLAGLVSVGDLEADEAAAVGELIDPRGAVPHLHPDHSLSLALERLGASGLHVIPVVSRQDVGELKGIAVAADIFRHYGLEEGA